MVHLSVQLVFVSVRSQAVYKMSVAAALTKPNPLTAEECTNRIFVRLDKDNNGEEKIFPFSLKSWCRVISNLMLKQCI